MTSIHCPSCGAEMSLDVCLAHEGLRQCYADMLRLTAPMPEQLFRYTNLFKPRKTRMRPERFAKLANELIAGIQAESINYNGRDWHVPITLWQSAFETLQARVETGKISLPLGNHNYLYTILADLSDKAEAVVEKEQEQNRRHPTSERRAGIHTGAVDVAQALGYKRDPELQKILNNKGDPTPEAVKKQLEQLKGQS